MPWTGSTFKSRHNHKLSPARAKKAASIANAMLKRGASEGLAIATASARAKGQKPRKHSKPFGSLAP